MESGVDCVVDDDGDKENCDVASAAAAAAAASTQQQDGTNAAAGNSNMDLAMVESPAWMALNLEHFAESPNIFNRQMVARGLLDTLRLVFRTEEDISTVMAVFQRLSEDNEPSVRAELVDQVPQLARFCQEQSALGLEDIFSRYLLPLVISAVSDPNYQVRRASHSSFLSLLGHNLLTVGDLQNKVCPILFQLANVENVDHSRTEVVTLLNHMATLINKDMARSLFLDRFVALCSDNTFEIRKVCAAQFGDICAVMGKTDTEEILLPRFSTLCEDAVWGVRKTCADVFVSVACICSLVSRRELLAPLFIALLADQSQWVRLAAFQALGPFISTFGDQNSQRLFYDDEGNVHVAASTDYWAVNAPTLESERDSGFGSEVCSNVTSPSEDVACGEEQTAGSDVRASDGDDYGSFLYWKEPLADIDAGDVVALTNVETDVECSTDAAQYHGFGLYNERWRRNYGTEHKRPTTEVESAKTTTTADSASSSAASAEETVYRKSFVLYDYCLMKENSDALPMRFMAAVQPQTIVPHVLLEQYMQMVDPCNLMSLDYDIVRCCAHSLPAVALTLGRKHWPMLKHLYTVLACDMQWRVRRAIAFSIHEISAILGKEIAALDLVPVFDGFIRDLDEVRIGILRNLSRFLGLLPEEQRNTYLPKIKEFLEPENQCNWRFRHELASQLKEMGPLFASIDLADHLLPVALHLLKDRVTEVRRTAGEAVAHLVTHINDDVAALEKVATHLVQQFAQRPKWIFRQTYAIVCSLVRSSLTSDFYLTHLLKSLAELVGDSVPNVRLAVAKGFCLVYENQEEFCVNEEEMEATRSALAKLRNDIDRDVRSLLSHCKL